MSRIVYDNVYGQLRVSVSVHIRAEVSTRYGPAHNSLIGSDNPLSFRPSVRDRGSSLSNHRLGEGLQNTSDAAKLINSQQHVAVHPPGHTRQGV